MIELRERDNGVILPVHAQAGARRNGVLGVRNGMLRIAVTAAPERGKANAAIAAVLAKTLGVAKSGVQLVGGATIAKKQFFILGKTADEIEAAIDRALVS